MNEQKKNEQEPWLVSEFFGTIVDILGGVNNTKIVELLFQNKIKKALDVLADADSMVCLVHSKNKLGLAVQFTAHFVTKYR